MDSAVTVGIFALVGVLIGAVAAGTLTGEFGPRRMFIGSVGLFSIAMLACAAALTAEIFSFFRFITGIGAGGLAPVGVAIAAEFAPPRTARGASDSCSPGLN